MKNLYEVAFIKIISIIAAAFLLSLVMSYPLMLLWNGCLVPAFSLLSEVSWLQMWGITFLIQSLCKTSNK